MTDGPRPVLEVRGLTVFHGQLRALTDVSLRVDAGEVYAMIGANGAGKSTLLRTIAGLHEPTEGTVLLDGEDVTSVTPERRLVAGIALVPEGRRLFPSLTVEENLLVGSYHSRPGPWDLERVYQLFGWMRERTHQRTAQLSGGEQQAVAIGRALVANPRVLLLDELSLGLAPVVVRQIYGLLPELLGAGMTVLARGAGRQSGRARGIAHPMPPRRTNHAGGTAGPVLPGRDRGRVLRAVHDGIGVVSWINAIVQGILVGGLFALFACGLSLLFGTMKVINLAHGDLAVVAAFLAVELAPVFHIPVVWSFLFVLPLFLVLGYVGQRTLIQASLDRGPLTTLLVTFGVAIVIENLLLQAFSADSHSLDIGSLGTASIHITDQIQVAYLSIFIFVLAVVVLLGLQYFLSRTRTGHMIRAVADDPEAARLVGIDYRHIFGIAASIAFATVALAGLAFGTYSSFNPTSGASRLLFAFEAVVIGGLGSLWGTLLGGIILGVAQAIGAHIDPSLQVLAGNAVFLVVLAVRPEGITGGRVEA